MSDFDRAFAVVIGIEKGYINDPNDPGKETKYGISKRAYPTEDIPNLTLARAKLLYRRDYWDKIRADDLPKGVALCLFDFAINSGVNEAIKRLQIAVDVPSDGSFGPITLAAVRTFSPRELIERFLAERIFFLAGLSTFQHFGRGWSRRVIHIAMESVS